MYITNRNQIAISATEISKLLQKEPGPFLTTIIDDIETKIVIKELINDKKVLKTYIINNYS